jgi:hypothetical protein
MEWLVDVPDKVRQHQNGFFVAPDVEGRGNRPPLHEPVYLSGTNLNRPDACLWTDRTQSAHFAASSKE